MKKYLLVIIAPFLFISCGTTPASNVAPNIDFSQYSFAAMGTAITGSAVILNEAHMQIQNALISLGFNVITDTRIRDLNPEQRSRLFIVEISISSDASGAVCLISFTDHLSNNLIGTFRGSSSWGWTVAANQRGAVNSAIRQMENGIRNNMGR